MAKHNEEASLRDKLVGVFVAQGVVAVLFGIAALFWPGLTATLFISLFGLFVLIWGLIALVQGFFALGRRNLWWLEAIFGILLIGLGVYLLRNPGTTAAAIILLVGFTLIVRGIIDIISGLFSKEETVTDNRWLYAALGAIGVILGVVVLTYPAATGLVFVWALGLYAVLFGAFNIGIAFRLRS